MTIAVQRASMSQAEFFAWTEGQEARFEFDGFQPVAMTGGSPTHNLIALSIHRALHARLAGTGCRALGMDAAMATEAGAIRFPDALVTCTKFDRDARLVPGVVVVFEVISPTSGRTDRIDKVREYQAVPSVRRYVILEYSSIGLTSFERASGDAAWTATTLTEGDVLHLPEIGIEIPVDTFYDGVEMGGTP